MAPQIFILSSKAVGTGHVIISVYNSYVYENVHSYLENMLFVNLLKPRH